MKHNFIHNLSDQVVRQNYQLKNNLQIVKNQLKDYEWQMIQFISLVTPNANIYQNIYQVFEQFVKQVKGKFYEVEVLKSHINRLTQKYEEAQKEQLNILNDLNKKKKEEELLKRSYQTTISCKDNQMKQLNQKIAQLQESNNDLIQQMCEARIEKLKLEQSVRKQIEQAKKIQNNQFNSFRQKDQEEHMSVYNQLKKDIQMRDKTIKEMSRSIALLTNSMDINNSQKILEDIFRSFQKFEQLSESYKGLKTENEQLREQTKFLFNRIIAQQSKLQQAKQIEYNLRNQLQRNGLQKRQLQAKIVAIMNELSKSNLQKAKMEDYYDMKWNEEYQNVKLKLERSFKVKIQALQRDCEQKIEEAQQKQRQAQRQKHYYVQRAKDLVTKCNESEQQRKKLQNLIVSINTKFQDLQQAHFQSANMHAEQLFTFKVFFQEQIKNQQQNSLKRQLALLNQISKRSKQYEKIIEQKQKLQQACQRQKQKYQELIQQQKKELAYYQEMQVQKIKAEMKKQMDLIPSIKAEVQQQITNKFKIVVQQKINIIQLKQHQFASNNQRWIDKYCELQKLHAFTRRKWEQEIQCQQKQKQQLLAKQQKLYAEIESWKSKSNCLSVQIKSLQTEIYNRKLIVLQKENKIIGLHKEINISKREIQMLIESKKTWKNQLQQLQKSFHKQLQQLNKISETTVNKLKDKIRELQDLNRQNCRSKREMLKIQSLNNEKLSLKSQITKKQAQNKILHQVKDYYETKLKEADRQIGKYQFKNTHVILTRRLKKNRLQTDHSKSHRIFSPKEQIDKKRYEITSVKKKFEITQGNITLRENERKYRRQTMTSLK